MLSPWLIDDVAGLRSRLGALRGRWRRRWDRFCREAELGATADGEAPYPLHAAFLYAVTGGRGWADRAADNLRWLRDRYDALVATGRPDSDTWMHAAPMARRAIGLDWVWDSSALTPPEREQLAELFVTDALRHAYVVLHHRIPPHANNQGLALALDLVVVGYLFGLRRGTDPVARHLLEFGLPHLLDQVALLPPGAYGSEGSTYAVGVEAPLAALACAALESITGEQVFDRPLGRWGNTFRMMLEHSPRLVAPSGLLWPWNQYGYQGCWAGGGDAYLAWRSGEPAWHHDVLRGRGWERSGAAAWLADDHVWQWLWMGEPATTSSDGDGSGRHDVGSWAEMHVGGALAGHGGTIYLTQVWNWSCWPPARTHMHPNAISLEAFGSPLLVDGHATADFDLAPLLAERVGDDPRRSVYDAGWWAPGCLGAHSCVIIDDAIEMTSSFSHAEPELDDPPLTGRLTRFSEEEGLAVLSADVTRFYRPSFPDVARVERTSALLADRCLVVEDVVEAAHEHRVAVQFVLRHGATRRSDGGVRLRTAEHVVLDVIPLGASDDELVDIPGFPSVLEGRCHHFRRTVHSSNLRLRTVLVPQMGRRRRADWSGQWRVTVVAHGRAAELKVDRIEELEDHLDPARRPETTVHLSRSVDVPAAAEGRWLLQLPQAYRQRVWLAGVELRLPTQRRHHHGEPDLVPLFVDVDEVLRPHVGHAVEVRIELSGLRRWGIHGDVVLHEQLEPALPRAAEAGGVVRVDLAGWSGELNTNTIAQGPAIPASPPSAGEEAAALAFRWVGALRNDASPSAHGPGAASDPLRQLALMMGDASRGAAPMDEADIAVALDLCGHAQWLVRMFAAKLLGVVREASAASRLRAMAGHDPVFRVRIMAAWSLGEIGDASAVDELVENLDPRLYYGLRRAAAHALAQIGSPRCLPRVMAGALDRDPEYAAACRRAIRRIGLSTAVSM